MNYQKVLLMMHEPIVEYSLGNVHILRNALEMGSLHDFITKYDIV